jgi:hypothetical protein
MMSKYCVRHINCNSLNVNTSWLCQMQVVECHGTVNCKSLNVNMSWQNALAHTCMRVCCIYIIICVVYKRETAYA